MLAIQYTGFGGPDVLRLEQVPIPEPGPGQVRLAVRAAGVNGLDWKIREGLLGTPPLPQRPGLECSGVVDVAGPGAPAAAGAEVFGWAATGAYADYALAEIVAPKPAELDWSTAACLPVVGEAALRSLRLLQAGDGDVLLIHGAGGAVGATATQLVLACGATVIGTTSAANADYVRSLGATPIRHGHDLVSRVRHMSSRIDAVLDTAGAGVLSDSIDLRGGTDRIVTLADPAAFEEGITFSSAAPGDRTADVLTDLADRVVTGRLRIRHARTYRLADAALAQRDNATGHAGGKITLSIS